MYWALGVAIGFGPVLDTPAVIALFQCGTEWPNRLMRSTGKLGVHFDTFLVINMTRVWCTCSTECISATSFASAFVVTCRRPTGKLLSNKPKQTQRISRLLDVSHITILAEPCLALAAHQQAAAHSKRCYQPGWGAIETGVAPQFIYGQ
jgi:hypothetical protein